MDRLNYFHYFICHWIGTFLDDCHSLSFLYSMRNSRNVWCSTAAFTQTCYRYRQQNCREAGAMTTAALTRAWITQENLFQSLNIDSLLPAWFKLSSVFIKKIPHLTHDILASHCRLTILKLDFLKTLKHCSWESNLKADLFQHWLSSQSLPSVQ